MVDGGDDAVDRVQRNDDGEDWSAGSSGGVILRVETNVSKFCSRIYGNKLFL